MLKTKAAAPSCPRRARTGAGSTTRADGGARQVVGKRVELYDTAQVGRRAM